MPRELIGLIPAAGRATRLGRLPCSKEIFPIGVETDSDGEPRPRPVIHGLLRGLASAGVERVVVVLREGKWDISARLGDGGEVGLDLAYLVVGATRNVPQTLERARAWTAGYDVALGFPDILLEPSDVWPRLAAFHRETAADVSLGLFPTEQSAKADMVELDDDGRIQQVVIKDPTCTLRWTWSIAIYSPAFGELLHAMAEASRAGRAAGAELYVGDVVRAAIGRGLAVRGLPFADGSFLDIGTPRDLQRAIEGASQGDARAASSEV